MTSIAGIEYLIGNWILYIMLIPLYLVGALIYDLHESYCMRRDSRQKAGEPPTVADWIDRAVWAVIPWAVGGLVALFMLSWAAAFAYALFFAPD